MFASGIVGAAIGFAAGQSFRLVTLLAFVYGVTVMLDSGALTAGLVARADDPRRGVTMALYSFAGFGMACLAPLVFGDHPWIWRGAPCWGGDWPLPPYRLPG